MLFRVFPPNTSQESTLHLVLRLRGTSVPKTADREDPSNFESLDAMQMSGISEHVIYDVRQRVTLRAKASAIVPVREYVIHGKRVVVYDRKINEVRNGAECTGMRGRAAGVSIDRPAGTYALPSTRTPPCTLPAHNSALPWGVFSLVFSS